MKTTGLLEVGSRMGSGSSGGRELGRGLGSLLTTSVAGPTVEDEHPCTGRRPLVCVLGDADFLRLAGQRRVNLELRRILAMLPSNGVLLPGCRDCI